MSQAFTNVMGAGFLHFPLYRLSSTSTTICCSLNERCNKMNAKARIVFLECTLKWHELWNMRTSYFFLIEFTVSYFGKGNGIMTHYLKNEFQLRDIRRARFIPEDRCHDDSVGERSIGIFQSYGTLRNILVISRQTTAFFHFRPNFETFIAV